MERDKRTFKQATANLTKLQKLSYIWTYYKFHIIVTIVVIATVFSITMERINHKESVLKVKVVCSGMAIESLTKLQENAESQLIGNRKKQEMTFSFTSDPNANGPGVIGNQEFAVRLAARELDLVILPKGGFEALAAQGAFLDLQSLPELSANNKDMKFINFKSEDSGGVEKPYGIDMSSFPVSQELYFAEKDTVIGILNAAENKEMAVKFINWLIKQKTL